MHVVITYDIHCHKNRAQIFRILREMGINSQRSVFECELSADEIRQLQARLRHFVTEATDSLLIYPLCKRCAAGVHILGQGIPLVQTDWQVI